MKDAVLSEPALPVAFLAACGLALAFVEVLGVTVFFALATGADLPAAAFGVIFF